MHIFFFDNLQKTKRIMVRQIQEVERTFGIKLGPYSVAAFAQTSISLPPNNRPLNAAK